ncbi:amidase signature enzyme [Microthyrium microscopicum]|uniref:amidase n=1 Tax=Microthyrium microscopicum TaxID=703497 RepID=A0A6A6UBE5_9PEZI|nr:amidase signature enzyme [Microthyrium microscopicum]
MSLPPFDYFEHRRNCQAKQNERASRIANLPSVYTAPVTQADQEIFRSSIRDLVAGIQNGEIDASNVIQAYGKMAVKAQEDTNCITEVMFDQAEAAVRDGQVNMKGPLAGLPVSLKDSAQVGGMDNTIGYSKYAFQAAAEDGVLVQLLKQAGAIPIVKTNLPTTLLSFESSNDVWGRSKNPHNQKYSPGGSTGGEAALLAYGGSRIGIGTDVAGSVRLPAHWSGCYALRCSTGRWPKGGLRTSMAGQEGIPSICSPMARDMDDLRYFTREFIKTKPWRLDHSVHPLEWRSNIEIEWDEKKVLKIGVMRDDGVVTPSPACSRALEMVVSALKESGHEIKAAKPPSPYEAFQIASHVLNADGCATFLSHFRSFESSDPGAHQLSFYMKLPRFVKYFHYLWVKYIKRDPIWAGLLKDWSPKTAEDNWQLVNKREAYKAKFHQWWNEEDIDVLLTVPNATPALPHKAMHDAVSSCGYTFLFNLLDYSAGVMPVTKVDADLDKLPSNFSLKKLNGVAQGAYKHYDSFKMSGLPVGVQVVGRRLEEEKVLSIMSRIKLALEANGIVYPLLNA